MCVLLMFTVVAAAPVTYESTCDNEQQAAIQPTTDSLLVIGTSILIGVGIGLLVSALMDNDGETTIAPVGEDTNIQAAARGQAMMYAAKSVYDISNTATILVGNNSETWALTQNYFNRAAEISASSLWKSGDVFDANFVIENSGAYNNIGNSYYNIKNALDYAIRNTADQKSAWSTVNWGEDISCQFIYKDKDGASQTVNSTSTMRLVFDSIVNVTDVINPEKNIVYLINSKDENGTSLADSGIWSKTGGTITNINDNTVTRTLVAGYNNVDDLPTGTYKLTSGTYAGMFLSLPESNIDVLGGCVLVNDVDTSTVSSGSGRTLTGTNYGFITTDANGLVLDYNGYKGKISNIGFSYSGDVLDSDRTGTELGTFTSENVKNGNPGCLDALIKAYSSSVTGYTVTVDKAKVFGQVMWQIVANAGEKCALLSPSSMIPDLTAVGIDSNQAYAIASSSIGQISDYYTNNKDYIKAGEVKISEQSLNLFCLGNLYDEYGVMIAENVIYTPYVNNATMTINNSEPNKFSEDAIIMIWSKDQTSLTDFTASDIDEHRVVIMPRGSSFTATSIKSQGEFVNSEELSVKQISKSASLKDADFVFSDTPKVISANITMLIIVAELGVIIALIGALFRTPLVIIIGAVVVVLGLLFPDTIADYILKWFGV